MLPVSAIARTMRTVCRSRSIGSDYRFHGTYLLVAWMTSAQAGSMAPSPLLARAIASFPSPRGYLAAATMGLPTVATLAAQRADLDLWESAQRNPMDYDGIVSRTRE